jgi:hypothetical protein
MGEMCKIGKMGKMGKMDELKSCGGGKDSRLSIERSVCRSS